MKLQVLEIDLPFSLANLDYVDILGDNDSGDYMYKPVEDWENQDVQDFIYNEIYPNYISEQSQVKKFQLQFQNFSGNSFKCLSMDQCIYVSTSISLGEVIYNAKERHIREEFDYWDFQEDNNNNNYVQPATSNLSDYNSDSADSAINFLPSPGNPFQEIDSGTIPAATPRKPGRPKNTSHCTTVRKAAKQKSHKVWEFLLDLLQNQDYCPKLIKWENFEEGMFKFVQSDQVARMWGRRKGNEKMTYEKFSRAMRYYYKSQVLLPVPGRRLVYKFGPHAKGWKNITPLPVQ